MAKFRHLNSSHFVKRLLLSAGLTFFSEPSLSTDRVAVLTADEIRSVWQSRPKDLIQRDLAVLFYCRSDQKPASVIKVFGCRDADMFRAYINRKSLRISFKIAADFEPEAFSVIFSEDDIDVPRAVEATHNDITYGCRFVEISDTPIAFLRIRQDVSDIGLCLSGGLLAFSGMRDLNANILSYPLGANAILQIFFSMEDDVSSALVD